LKTAATVAVASSVHGRIQRRQQARWAAPAPPPPQHGAPPQQAYAEPASPPTPAGPPADTDMGERLNQLKQLGKLLSAGVLSQAEFDQQKGRILNG